VIENSLDADLGSVPNPPGSLPTESRPSSQAHPVIGQTGASILLTRRWHLTLGYSYRPYRLRLNPKDVFCYFSTDVLGEVFVSRSDPDLLKSELARLRNKLSKWVISPLLSKNVILINYRVEIKNKHELLEWKTSKKGFLENEINWCRVCAAQKSKQAGEINWV